MHNTFRMAALVLALAVGPLAAIAPSDAQTTGRSKGRPGYQANRPPERPRCKGRLQGRGREDSRGMSEGKAGREAGRARIRPRHKEAVVDDPGARRRGCRSPSADIQFSTSTDRFAHLLN